MKKTVDIIPNTELTQTASIGKYCQKISTTKDWFIYLAMHFCQETGSTKQFNIFHQFGWYTNVWDWLSADKYRIYLLQDRLVVKCQWCTHCFPWSLLINFYFSQTFHATAASSVTLLLKHLFSTAIREDGKYHIILGVPIIRGLKMVFSVAGTVGRFRIN